MFCPCRLLSLLMCSLVLAPLAAQISPSASLQQRTPEDVERQKKAERHITLDLVVSDASGNAARGLEAADLTILNNGQAQQIASFHRLESRSTIPPPEIVLLVDAVNSTFQDLTLAREGVTRFLQRNDGHLALPVSVVFLSDAGVKLEPASRDGNALAADFAQVKSPIRVFDSAQGSSGWVERTQRSIRALTQLTRYEATRPGRKLLVWVGPGWPLLNGPTPNLDAENKRRYFGTIVELNTSLRRAQVTLYSVVPLNLAQGTGLRTFLYQEYLKGVQSPAQADAPELALQVFASHSGGLVLYKSGDVSGEIARCVADADAYYEVTFDAAPAQKQDEYHSLEVKVNRPGVSARTRTLFYQQP